MAMAGLPRGPSKKMRVLSVGRVQDASNRSLSLTGRACQRQKGLAVSPTGEFQTRSVSECGTAVGRNWAGRERTNLHGKTNYGRKRARSPW